MIYRGVKAMDLAGGRGIEEVAEVPLCWDCVIEMEVGEERGEGENAAFWEGLRGAGGVTGGGLLRDRWDGRRAKGGRVGSLMSGCAVRYFEAGAVYHMGRC